jgi:hypothetical protein
MDGRSAVAVRHPKSRNMKGMKDMRDVTFLG